MSPAAWPRARPVDAMGADQVRRLPRRQLREGQPGPQQRADIRPREGRQRVDLQDPGDVRSPSRGLRPLPFGLGHKPTGQRRQRHLLLPGHLCPGLTGIPAQFGFGILDAPFHQIPLTLPPRQLLQRGGCRRRTHRLGHPPTRLFAQHEPFGNRRPVRDRPDLPRRKLIRSPPAFRGANAEPATDGPRIIQAGARFHGFVRRKRRDPALASRRGRPELLGNLTIPALRPPRRRPHNMRAIPPRRSRRTSAMRRIPARVHPQFPTQIGLRRGTPIPRPRLETSALPLPIRLHTLP